MANFQTSFYGTQVRILASNTLPAGIDVTEFADDADPITFEEMTVANLLMGANGDTISFSTPSVIKAIINLIPTSPSELAMTIIFNANRVGKGKLSANDTITMVVNYPSGRTDIYSKGRMLTGNPGLSGSSDGRLKSMPFSFAFTEKNGTVI